MASKGSALTDRRSSAGDYLKFLQAWLRKPRQTASIVPSSPHLGRLMASQIDPQGGLVMEFGGGTGALTRQILATGLPRTDLEVVEINPGFARNLRRDFPNVSIIEAPAQAVVAQSAGGAGAYQCVISGLPLLAMSKGLQSAIVTEAFRLLRPGGAFIQFTYSPRPPVADSVADALDLGVERIGTIVRNVPPATVFRYRRAVDIAAVDDAQLAF
ncbi:MAG: methyltransferase domain-containing protein [Alphaproteobacteria bacterium]|jgi:Phospholipid N-methyltransferase|nr:methyltransferase domain-containing protein [Alphaproteobacteria bacterium]MBU0793086.1 methyltransferase domain-containing protein [Alphaproteobacteria bacterium]MBU0877750.1 methyltransferase domain-containing protein [Alphaproteobacteria bacterium]MBU1771138.1 methyltransferase domain-containing protein [Alphaproteobacteria bacterium]